ncbi:hypothetical protein DFH09DRAFT_1355596 [Mycena vulgaris]|nr:hypothetical protein DFH09DRAFT_1355596 [Mycena vulgaris]
MPLDLKQVGQLFKDILEAVRNDAPDMDALEPAAIAWLKNARYKIMREIEKAYYSLDQTRDTPMSQPAWAVDPSQALWTSTPFPVVLSPYSTAFRNNLAALMVDCGFHNCVVGTGLHYIYIQISFPAVPRVSLALDAAPETLHVDDEFSRMVEGAPPDDRKPIIGAFAGTDFARLLGATRGEGSKASGSKSGKGKKRVASRAIKDESNDDEGPRLRSMTRASSTATLRSNAGSVRRSGRKRVKNEDLN